MQLSVVERRITVWLHAEAVGGRAVCQGRWCWQGCGVCSGCEPVLFSQQLQRWGLGLGAVLG
jgi:hypothetical protein